MTRRVKLVVAYDGAGFHGFAPNEGVRTVLGVLTEAIATVVRVPADALALTGAGRTDAGVHAWGQVVSGDLPDDAQLRDLRRRLNRLCAPDIAVRGAEWVGDDFNARYSARWRHYRYDVWHSGAPNPLLAGRAWWVAKALDLPAMRAAGDLLVGEHDFASFCRRPKVRDGDPAPSMTRRLELVRWSDVSEAGDATLLRCELRANAFCHQMVRSIVGTLVDVGTGKLAAAAMPNILAATDRAAAGQVAPPHGLTLWEVGY